MTGIVLHNSVFKARELCLCAYVRNVVLFAFVFYFKNPFYDYVARNVKPQSIVPPPSMTNTS